MQYSTNHLNFLREKIMDTKVALFKSEINSELTLPTNVIQTISTDDEGHIYFLTSCNKNYIKYIAQPFYTYLDYNKKGFENRLCVSGKAVIVKEENNPDDLEDEIYESNVKTIILIKMKIMQAEFIGNYCAEKSTSWTQKLKNSIQHFFYTDNHQRFDFSQQ